MKIESIDGGSVTCDDHLSFWMNKDELDGVNVGDEIDTDGAGLGSTINKITVNGRVVRDISPRRRAIERKRWLAELEAKRAVELEEGYDQWVALVSYWPQSLQERVARFDAKDGLEFWQDAPYELGILEQALYVSEELKTVEAIDEFNAMTWDEQMATLPFTDKGHSGWSWSSSIVIAKALVNGVDL